MFTNDHIHPGRTIGKVLLAAAMALGSLHCASGFLNQKPLLLEGADARGCKQLFKRRTVRWWVWNTTGPQFSAAELRRMEQAGSIRIQETVEAWDYVYFGLVLIGFVPRTVIVEQCPRRFVATPAARLRQIQSRLERAAEYETHLKAAVVRAAGARGMTLRFARGVITLDREQKQAIRKFHELMRSGGQTAGLVIKSVAGAKGETGELARQRAQAVLAVMRELKIRVRGIRYGVVAALPVPNAADESAGEKGSTQPAGRVLITLYPR